MSVKIFFCYAHEDEALLDRLKVHLSPLQREGLIWLWHDRDIRAGTEWDKEINRHLNTAQIILLLVSPDFMNSDYCYSIELRRAIERHDKGEARVIPIILRPASWDGILGKLQALPRNGKPIRSRYWHNMDEALTDVVQSIRKTINDLSSESISNITPMPDKKDETLIGRFSDIFKTRAFTPEELKASKVAVASFPTGQLPHAESNTTSIVVPSLCIKQEGGLWQVYQITKSLNLGRKLDNDIFLEDIMVSRQHAILNVDSDGNCILKDIGSANGTIVNGKILRNSEIHLLKEGDVIQLGQTLLVFNSGRNS
jgi:hypothetical protein